MTDACSVLDWLVAGVVCLGLGACCGLLILALWPFAACENWGQAPTPDELLWLDD